MGVAQQSTHLMQEVLHSLAQYSEALHNHLHSPHELKADAEVVAEVKVVQHMDNVVPALGILCPEGVQDLHLHESLVVEALLVPNHFNGHRAIGPVVQGLHRGWGQGWGQPTMSSRTPFPPTHLDDLPKGPLPYHLKDLVPIGHVVVGYLVITAIFIIVATVLRSSWYPLNLLGLQPQEPNLRVLQHLSLLVRGHV